MRDDKLISVAEAAARLDVGQLTMLALFQRNEVAGRIRSVPQPGRPAQAEIGIEPASVEAYRARTFPDPTGHRARIEAERRLAHRENDRRRRQVIAEAHVEPYLRRLETQVTAARARARRREAMRVPSTSATAARSVAGPVLVPAAVARFSGPHHRRQARQEMLREQIMERVRAAGFGAVERR